MLDQGRRFSAAPFSIHTNSTSTAALLRGAKNTLIQESVFSAAHCNLIALSKQSTQKITSITCRQRILYLKKDKPS